MSLYDPLGFIAHLTARGRMLLQDIWKSGVGWDEELKEAQVTKWNNLLEQIKKIPQAKIRRCLAQGNSKAIQLHVFCDASQQAFGCSAYLRVTGENDEVSVNLVMAKSRVAPLKCTSIPRLELEAALIGARMKKFIQEGLDLKIDDVYLWTDSKNVLCWIRAEDPRKFKVYVGHRIGEILDNSEVHQWRWVPTAENVADDATRDHCQADVSPESRWFNGPRFLLKPESEWPTEKKTEVEEINTEELEVRKCCMVVTEKVEAPKVNDFSDWKRLVRVTAWIQRYFRNLKEKDPSKRQLTTCLKVQEVREAEFFWIKKSQEASFPEELECLKQRKEVMKSSRLSKLSPVLINGVICLKSRIMHAPHIPEEYKFPPILDAKEPWTKLLVAWYHRVCGHHGRELICNEIRQRYWILGVKAAVKLASKECLECQMWHAKPIIPEMAALPEVRVRKPSRPFSYVGVDYFGPLDVVNGRKHEKRYGVLFTCLSTRAVHLEMAYSLSTDDFLQALTRFICRRGEPEEIWSDNGTNFRGAEIEMKKAMKELDLVKIEDRLCAREIKWNFNPPGAPHMGGAWERLVRSVKTAMYAILKNRTLSDQLLSTVFAEAEASVNSRPLTIVSTDKDDEEAITPNCFLMGTTSIKQRPGYFPDDDLCLRKRWRHAQVLANHFWKRWIKEYLPSLSRRTKWTRKTPDVKVGEIVFVADANQLRNNWIKGRVEVVHPGPDGQVRVVDVRTASGIIKRPVVKLLRIHPNTIPQSDSDKLNHREEYVAAQSCNESQSAPKTDRDRSHKRL